MAYFSLSLLFEAFDAQTKQPRKSYEHRIVLVQLPEKPSYTTIINYCQQHLKEEAYPVADGTEVVWQVTKIIDVFALAEDISVPLKTPIEVYSRYFADDFDCSQEAIIAKYFADYVWQDEQSSE